MSLIIVISAPSGSGKTTLITKLLEKYPDIVRSVSYTTRSPREEEKSDEDYIFISKEEFKRRIGADYFLEWEEKFGNYYGTPKEQFEDAWESGKDIVLSLDIKGARTVKKKFPESISVFIMPPSTEELEERLKKRDKCADTALSVRLGEAQEEIAASDEYDYLIVNKNAEKAAEELRMIIENEKKNRKEKIKKV